MSFKDPFKLVPVNDIAEIADKFTRNEILTSNEPRQTIGMKPSGDPKADMLLNSNISQPEEIIQEIYGENGSDDTSGETSIMDRPYSEIAEEQYKEDEIQNG